MAECKGCFHYKVCDGDVGFGYAECPHYIQSADVVPKSEYDAAIIDRNAARLGMIAEHERLKTAKTEVARTIFAEIDQLITNYFADVISGVELIVRIAELKKKYIPQDCPN